MKSLLGATLAIFGCCMALAAQQHAVQPTPQPAAPVPLTPQSTPADQAEAAKGANAFAIDLYRQLSSQPGNLFFSPESITTAFAMAYGGARGETAAEMARVLHYTLPPGRLHPAMGSLLAAMNAPHANYELHVADALWAQKDASLLPEFLALSEANYAAGLRRVDFRQSPEAARIEINNWAAQQTNNKIQNILPPGVVTPATELILTNAIYFKGQWETPFKTRASRLDTFHVSASRTVQTMFMNRTGSMSYYDGGSFQELELPYQGNDLAMVILLPKKADGLAALEHDLTAAAIEKWIGNLKSAEKVNLSLPRFTFTQQFELSQTLAAMGMAHAFGPAADFSAMTGKPAFNISAAIHKAFVDVNETGTEAAAVTAIGFEATAVRIENPPIPFIADHPFLFLIRDTKSGSILFLGRIEEPATGGSGAR
jgi:serpin B